MPVECQKRSWTPEELCAAKEAYDRVIRVRAALTPLSSDDRRGFAKSILDIVTMDRTFDVNTLVRQANAKFNAVYGTTPRGIKKRLALADKADCDPTEGEGRAA